MCQNFSITLLKLLFQKFPMNFIFLNMVDTPAFNLLDPSEATPIFLKFFSLAFTKSYSSSSSRPLRSLLLGSLIFFFLLLNLINSKWSSTGLELEFSLICTLHTPLGHYFSSRALNTIFTTDLFPEPQKNPSNCLFDVSTWYLTDISNKCSKSTAQPRIILLTKLIPNLFYFRALPFNKCYL